MSFTAASSLISQAAADFICIQVGRDCDTSKALQSTRDRLMSAKEFLTPMLDAFYQEAAPHLYDSCNSDIPSPHCPFYPAWPLQKERLKSNYTDCICGTPWSHTAMKIHANVDPNRFDVTSEDSIHDVSDEHVRIFALRVLLKYSFFSLFNN
jgi:hypothetical protein